MLCCLCLSPPIEAQGDSIDFYLQRKALDPYVDELEDNESSCILTWCHDTQVLLSNFLEYHLLWNTLPQSYSRSSVLNIWWYIHHNRTYDLEFIVVHCRNSSDTFVSAIKHGKERFSSCFHISQWLISRSWWASAACLWGGCLAHIISGSILATLWPSESCLAYQQCGEWGASAMDVSEVSVVGVESPTRTARL